MDAHSVAYRFAGKVIENFSFASYAATFSNMSPYIDLPYEISENILHYLGADVLNRVERDRGDSMPDLVLNLGPDRGPFILKPHDCARKQRQLGVEHDLLGGDKLA